MQLGPNGTRVLIALGLGPALERVVCPAAGKEIRLWNTGQSWKLFDLGEAAVARYGAPYWMVHRGDLHRVLLDAVRAACADAIHLGAAVAGYTQDPAGVTLHLAGGETLRGDVLVGADGVHSPTRRQMVGEGGARFTGLMAWRGLVPMDRLPAHQRRLVGANWNGPGGHVVTYPLRRGKILNFVGVTERSDWQVESWTEAGTTAECLGDFTGWHADVQRIIGAIDTPYKWALLGRAPLACLVQGLRARCWATRHIRCCPSWRRARTWRSRTGRSWRAAWRPRQSRRGAAPLRCRARRAHVPRGARLARRCGTVPQPGAGRRRGRGGVCRSRVAAGKGRSALRLGLCL